MNDAHPLNRPAFAALSSHWAKIAVIEGEARRIHPDYGPFAATDRPEHLEALLPLARTHGAVWIVEDRMPAAFPPGLKLEKQAEVIQMVATELTPPPTSVAFEEMTDADGPEMRDLALMTEPGPFAAKTHLLGRFVGVRRDGQIAAMAGERMRLPGFTEVSGVCTHPDHRGQGLAALLTHEIARGIIAAGSVPFLHCYPSNAPAVRAYEKIGFVTRRTLTAMILTAE
jgi:predicted GNAT family acetyltransferase